MNPQTFGTPRIGWRWPAALILFLLGFAGFATGVAPSERPDVAQADLLTKAYYSLGLFVVGGLDIGTPVSGPLLGRAMLWIAYFGAPLLTASAVIEAVIRVMAPQRWQMRRLQDHVVIVGSGELTISYLRVLRARNPTIPVVVVDEHVDPVREQELSQAFGVRVVIGNITHDFVQNGLRLERAARVVLLGDSDFQAFEAASKMLRRFPHLESKVVLHCGRLRFLRSMEATAVGRLCVTFNSYHLAATSLVQQRLVGHFATTRGRDVVVLAGSDALVRRYSRSCNIWPGTTSRRWSSSTSTLTGGLWSRRSNAEWTATISAWCYRATSPTQKYGAPWRGPSTWQRRRPP